ncbi:hypothetical protein [Desulfosarcina ovata]|uniref:Lipoprotein n=1 Tax=Desulfosarcina ovata subsp. ovata TaxID=2752305 RepID=A0A5K8AG01_9BACT|nr:hypothetical protein [Desulfosarcina ovata]BBO91615.1 hypothetical protein DSCOOX_47950 [Desulfosarcina ovata subsp. ovata]
MRKAAKIIAGVVLAGVLMFAGGCAERPSRVDVEHHPTPLPTATPMPSPPPDVPRVWGDPVAVIPLSGGLEKRIYRSPHPYNDLNYRYLLVQDDMVLASGVSDVMNTDTADAPGGATTGFVPGDLSRTFYADHRMTVADLNQIWGTPVQVLPLSGGAEVRTYAISDSYTDFKYRRYIVKDGIVLASRISPSPDIKAEAELAGFKGIEINEISHAYYKRHPMRLTEVETVWGKPVTVRQAGTGLERRYYKISAPSDMGFEFRFFVVRDRMVVSSGICDTVGVEAN